MNENPFKEKLYHHTLPVSDELWGRIESQLPSERKRYPLFYFTLAFLVLAAGLIVFALALRQSQDKTGPAPQDKLPPEVTPLSELPVAYDELKVVSNIQTEPLANVNTTEEKLFARNDDRAEINDKKHNNKNYTADNISRSGSRPSSLKSNANTGQQNENLQRDTRFHSLTSAIESDLGSFESIAVIGIDEISIEERAVAEEMSAIRPDPSCYKFTAEDGKSNISVDIFSAPGFGPRSFASTDIEDDLYINARKATENQEYAWSAGGRVNLNLSREFALRVGVMYEQIGDLFDYTDTLATQRSTRIDSFFAADGTFLYAETNTVLIFGTLIKKIHNRYHHLDIPLLASYELCLGRSIFMLNAGPVLNISTSSRGQILNPGFTPQHITEGESSRLDAYKNNLGLSVYVGAGALIPFNKYFSGLIEPRFLYRIKPVTKTSYPLKEHRHFAGLNLGIRYHFD